MKGEWKRRNYRTDNAEIIASKKSQATTRDVEPLRLNEYEYFLDVLNVLSDLPSQSAIANLLPDRWKPKVSR